MAGAKKKKKPAANPARGFATTSIASKPRPEPTAEESKSSHIHGNSAPPSTGDKAPPSTTASAPTADDGSKTGASQEKALSPEEFEKQLEESELQLLVEKHSQKVKRDAQRQVTRLETDRRLLRANADSINSVKWLPEDLMGHILDLIKAEGRFAASNILSETPGRMPSEEDMITRLWTLQQTLTSAGFPETRVRGVLQYILEISPNITSTGKDLIWGLEEALDWMGRECDSSELPAYDKRPRPVAKGGHRFTTTWYCAVRR